MKQHNEIRYPGASGDGLGKPPDTLALRLETREKGASEHFVQFYECDAFLVNSVSDFIGGALTAGEAGVVIATPAHRKAIWQTLAARGLDVAAAQVRGQYVGLDAADTLSKFLVDASPDPRRFAEVVGGLITQAGQGPRRVRAFGEMVALLCAEGHQKAAMALEELWNELAKTYPFSLFCAYPIYAFDEARHGVPFHHICSQHARVLPTESYTGLESPDERLRAISLLQQKAQSLEREIAYRIEVEKALSRRERELTDFFENALEGLHWVGPDGRILWANQAELKLLGYEPEEYIGHSITEFHVDREVIDEMLEKLLCGETLYDQPARLRCKDGSLKQVLIHSNAYFEDGKFLHTCCFTRDVTDRLQAEEAVREMAGIVEGSADAIVSKTLDGVIRTWNAGAERMYGYCKEEAIGRTITMLLPDDRVDEEAEIIERIRRGERIEHFETVRIRKDGQRVNVSLTLSPIRDKEGTITGVSHVGRDITERKQLQRERDQLFEREQRAREDAEAANRAKDDFLATVSHELRTPLTAMLGWTRMVRSGTLDADRTAHALETIERNAKAQAQLIEDLLDISRIISGKLLLNLQTVVLGAVIHAALRSIRPAAQAKGIALESKLGSEALWVSADPDRLQQVVWNLLSNAIKFTPKGGRVTVELQPVNSRAEIRVRDTGQGIRADFLPYVFDRFRQADSTATRVHGGLGLGLAIVRHLVELHGGSVSVASAGEGQGATFTLQLPISALRMESIRSKTGVSSGIATPFVCPVSLAGLRILVVDDEADTLELIGFVLRAGQAEVLTAASAKEAVEVFQKTKPDLLISDIGMPEEDGYDLIQKIRQLPGGRKVPALALTAYARVEDRMRVLSAGYNMHVAKPVEPVELLTVLASLMR